MSLSTTTSRPHEHLEEVRDSSSGVTLLRIDREDALGALSRSLMHALDEQIERLRGDDEIRALVLTGTGKGFIAGADISEYHGVSQGEFDGYQRLGREVFSGFESLPQYTIAAVNGFALGGGFEIALCFDAIVASERARFGLPEIHLGLLPGGGGTQRLARALGVRFTKQLVVTGHIVQVEELDRRGLLAGVHPPEKLLDAAMELARQVSGNAPLSVRHAKRVIDDGVALPISEALTLEQQTLSELFATADAQEGISAFVEKRKPQFRGT